MSRPLPHRGGRDPLPSSTTLMPDDPFDWNQPVHVPAFSRQPEDDEVVIGHPLRGSFLALPKEAVEILDLLAAGRSVAEARDEFALRHGETPDVQDLLSVLAQHEFVHRRGRPASAPEASVPPAGRFHFESLPQSWARLFVHPATLATVAVLIACSVAVAARNPEIVPGWRALVFPQSMGLMVLGLITAALLTTFFHEMAHLTAARARGVSCRLGIGHRLWILVAETDMSGLWTLPRRQRYLPLLAGMLLDAATAAVLLLVFHAAAIDLLVLPQLLLDFLRALWMIYALRIAWQFFFFVRTDVYYVCANAFGCKNLMRDSEDLLRSLALRLLGRPGAVDQSHIRSGERRAIRAYAVLWLVGRAFALVVLFTVSLPVLFDYVRIVVTNLRRGPAIGLGPYAESILIAAVSLTTTLAGFVLWLRSLRQGRRAS